MDNRDHHSKAIAVGIKSFAMSAFIIIVMPPIIGLILYLVWKP